MKPIRELLSDAREALSRTRWDGRGGKWYETPGAGNVDRVNEALAAIRQAEEALADFGDQALTVATLQVKVADLEARLKRAGTLNDRDPFGYEGTAEQYADARAAFEQRTIGGSAVRRR
jgi:hypothetical protein